jgi:hypothetical protein
MKFKLIILMFTFLMVLGVVSATNSVNISSYELVTNNSLDDVVVNYYSESFGTTSSSSNIASWNNPTNAFDNDESTHALLSNGQSSSISSYNEILFNETYVGLVKVRASSSGTGLDSGDGRVSLSVQTYDGSSWSSIWSDSETYTGGGAGSAGVSIDEYLEVKDSIQGVRVVFGGSDSDGYSVTFRNYDVKVYRSFNDSGIISDGEYEFLVSPEGYFDKNFSLNISGDTNYNVYGLYSSLLDVSFRDVVSEAIINTSTQYVNVTNFAGYQETFSTTNGTLSIPLISGDYGFTGWSNGYAYEYVNTTISSSSQSLNIDLFTNNTIILNVYDISDGSALDNYTVTLTNNGTVYQNISGVGDFELRLADVLSGEYSVTVERDGYSDGEYTLTMTGGSYQFFNAYLFAGDDNVVFTVVNIETGGVVEGATFGMYASLNGTWTVVNSRETDITGAVRYPIISDVEYKYVIVKEGFEDREFTLKPIENTYTVRLTPSTDSNPDLNIGGWVYTINNSGDFISNSRNEFSITILSGSGSIEYYSLNVSFPDGTKQVFECSNSIGCTHDFDLNITGSPLNDSVVVEYSLREVGMGNKYFRYNYLLDEVYSDNTLAGWLGSDIGDLEKAFMATVIMVILIGAVATVAVGVGAPAVTVSSLLLVVLMYAFSFIDFIPNASAHIAGIGLLLIVIFGRGEI